MNADRSLAFYTGLSGQYASTNLDVVEKFQLGGANGVRAYPSGEAIGDKGLMLNLELRKSVAKTKAGEFGVFGFYDAGSITQFTNLYPAAIAPYSRNHYSIKGAGVGASLVNNEFGSVKVVFARKIGDNPNPSATGMDADGKSDKSRILIFGNILF